MATSATGPSNSSRRRRRAAPRASGFTLLEVLVVIVIIGIIASMAVVSTRVLGGDHEMDEEAERLAAVLTQVREEALLQGRDVGLRVDARGYDFLYFDGRISRWELVAEDPLLRERTLPDGLEAELWLESRQVQLPLRTAPTELVQAQPQVVVMASGDMIPFELRLRRGGTEEVRAVIGRTDGTLETLANDEVTDR